MKAILLNLLAVAIAAAGIAGLFAWESAATKADKEFYNQAIQGHKSMY